MIPIPITRQISPKLIVTVLLVSLTLSVKLYRNPSYAASASDELLVRGEWVRAADAPISARNDATVAWNGSEIFVFGGTYFICPGLALCMAPSDPPLADGAAYDPITNEWRIIADAPVGIIAGRVARVGDNFFVLAKTSYNTWSSRLLRYRSTLDAWDELNLPEDIAAANIAAFGDAIMLYSYSDEEGVATDWLLDTQSERWTPMPDDPLGLGFSRQYLAHGDDLYLFDHALVPSPGGASGPSYLRAARFRQGQWTALPTADSIGSAPNLIADKLLIAPELGCADGGNSNNYGRCIPFGAAFDTTTDTWHELPSAPERGTRYVDYSGGIGDGGLVLYRPGFPAIDAVTGEWFRVPALDTDVFMQRTPIAAGPYGFAFGGTRHSNSGKSLLLHEAWIWVP